MVKIWGKMPIRADSDDMPRLREELIWLRETVERLLGVMQLATAEHPDDCTCQVCVTLEELA